MEPYQRNVKGKVWIKKGTADDPKQPCLSVKRSGVECGVMARACLTAMGTGSPSSDAAENSLDIASLKDYLIKLWAEVVHSIIKYATSTD